MFKHLKGTESIKPKNVLFILADDLGWKDTEPYGSTFYQTPGIKSLAAKGMLFTDAYAASPLCSPTRASILTGRNPGRLHMTMPTGHEEEEILVGRERSKAPSDQKVATPIPINRLYTCYHTLGEDFKAAGYHTALMGKWHLGHAPHIPENFGFDKVVGGRFHSGPPAPGNFFAPWNCDTLPDVEAGTHITDVLGDEAVKFIEEKQNDPFFLCLWFYDVHAPFQAKKELKEKYRKLADDSNPQRNPTMGGMVELLDQNIGKVLNALERLKLEDDTIIVFTSDNGGNMYDVVEGLYPTNNFPLRSGKGNNYEGGVRVPLIVHWPGVTIEGTRNRTVVSSVDFYPTLLAMLDRPLAPQAHLDGVSFVPALKGGAHDRGPMFSHFPHWVPAPMNLPNTSVRVGDWKLYRFYHDAPNGDHRFELYNLQDDIGEHNNLADQCPEKVQQFDALIEAEIKQSNYLLPRPNRNYKGNVAGTWIGNEHAAVEVKRGILSLRITGEHSQISTRATPSLREMGLLRVQIKSKETNQGSIAFQDGEEWQREVEFQIRSDNQWHEYEIALPVRRILGSINISPMNASGEVEFRSIEIWTTKGELLTKYRFY